MQSSWLRSSLRCRLLLTLWKSLIRIPGKASRRSMWTCHRCWARTAQTLKIRDQEYIVTFPSLPPQSVNGGFQQGNKREPSIRLALGKPSESWSWTENVLSPQTMENKWSSMLKQDQDPQTKDYKGLFIYILQKAAALNAVRSPASSFRDSFPNLQLKGCSDDRHSFSVTMPGWVT